MTKSVYIFPDKLPFKAKLMVYACQNCKQIKGQTHETRKYLKRIRLWMIKEHFGIGIVKGLKKRDHFKKIFDESQSLLGEAPKGVFLSPQPSSEKYLFKYPKIQDGSFTHGFREIVTEQLMTHLVGLVTKAARTSLGCYKNSPVILSKFIVNNKIERLIHGIEIFSELYDQQGINEIHKSRESQRSFYSVQHIKEALSNFCGADFQNIYNDFCMMLLSDAWVGNQDRHAENWGLIETLETGKLRFAPLFDTARGLLWNSNLYELKKKYLDCASLQKYIEASSPLMSLTGHVKPTHFDVSKHVKVDNPAVYSKFVNCLNRIDLKSELVGYEKYLSPTRVNLIYQILKIRRKRITHNV